ncbi:hypothetical protein JIP49_002462 [Salmonella enterica]|nr:hypothetical protein [Salmonella enterica subsp. enterica]EBH5439306.1 hypothetical protein [Salmonella enterica]EDP9256322.1 hypothetical protein [Salmonella enterica subsp. enterica serovar Newmexico]ECU0147429.1 hypothetical protein [Salmonella enterica]EDJ7028037.1 hypothetical protein [Salmonella enterica]
MSAYKIGTKDPEEKYNIVSEPCFEIPQYAITSIYNKVIHGVIMTNFPGLFTGNQIVKHFTSHQNLTASDCTLENYSNIDSLINDATILGKIISKGIFDARNSCENLAPGTHFINSHYGDTGYFTGERSFYLSTGIFQHRGKGNVIVTDSHYARNYNMNLEFIIFDRYKSDTDWLDHINSGFFNDLNHIPLFENFSLYGKYKLASIKWSQSRVCPVTSLTT